MKVVLFPLYCTPKQTAKHWKEMQVVQCSLCVSLGDKSLSYCPPELWVALCAVTGLDFCRE